MLITLSRGNAAYRTTIIDVRLITMFSSDLRKTARFSVHVALSCRPHGVCRELVKFRRYVCNDRRRRRRQFTEFVSRSRQQQQKHNVVIFLRRKTILPVLG